MNLQEAAIMKQLVHTPFVNQRLLSETSGYSLGVVNKSIRNLIIEGYLDERVQLTAKAQEAFTERAPRNAVILAAGLGMRMVPINLSTPKAMLEVRGERMIDRLIRQLHDAGIRDITVVVGFMKESFEYLMDDDGVDLVVNRDYASKNNLHSLALVADRIQNTYIVPCDIHCEVNPFSRYELHSWYMVSDALKKESTVRVNRKLELVEIPREEAGNGMVGIAYLTGKLAAEVRSRLKRMDGELKYADAFWEETIRGRDRMLLPAKVVRSADYEEINSYEQLREIDSASNQLKSDAMRTIAAALGCREDEIVNISILKKGMTNRSFMFSARGSRYIMRIPGEGTDRLIDRKQEAAVFRAISGLGLCDDPVYIDPENGYKITRYLEGVRTCDPGEAFDLKRCMAKLRQFHQMRLKVSHAFDIFGQIDFYESLWEGAPSAYRDYARTKANVLSLRPYIEGMDRERCLTHIDAVPDNFLFYRTEAGEQLQLTDWEYAGMQDPHVDIAMFCIYSLFDKARCDRLIDMYFEGDCGIALRAKIYCYIAACGLLWSNWCEYKRRLGVEFGEYSLRQYRYAKDFYRYARALMEQGAGEE